jgi:hypothetical protein
VKGLVALPIRDSLSGARHRLEIEIEYLSMRAEALEGPGRARLERAGISNRETHPMAT